MRAAIGRAWRIAIFLVLLAGCGGFPGVPPAGFVNRTRHSDAALWDIWKKAQLEVEQSVDLNPLQRSLSDAPPHILPGDGRAAHILPRQLKVIAAPDVLSSILFDATGVNRADPTGLIACPQPCNVHYATAYSFYQRPLTKYAASWESQADNFSQILQYEFENQILSALGYDMRWR